VQGFRHDHCRGRVIRVASEGVALLPQYLRTLSGSCQRILEEHLDRVALFGAVAASLSVQVAALFELIELIFRNCNWPPKEAVLAAPAMPRGCLADLFSAGRHVASGLTENGL
jgi:hypothetical protein